MKKGTFIVVLSLTLMVATAATGRVMQNQDFSVGMANTGMVMGGMGAAQSTAGAMACNAQGNPWGYQKQAGGIGGTGSAKGMGSVAGFAQMGGIGGDQSKCVSRCGTTQKQNLGLCAGQIQGKTGRGIGSTQATLVAGASSSQGSRSPGATMGQSSSIGTFQSGSTMGGPCSTVVVASGASATTSQTQSVGGPMRR
ncbi:hypothetical protein ACFL6U_14095 [Planctomycetota bacterium]